MSGGTECGIITGGQGLGWVFLGSWPLIQRTEKKGSPRLQKKQAIFGKAKV